MVNKSNFRRSREKIEQLFDSIETQIWHLIDSRTYGYANRAHAEFFGLKAEDMEFRDIYSFISKKEADVCLESNKKIYNQKAQNVSEEWIKNANGQLRLLKITKAPILDDDNNVEMIICTAEDITEKKELERQKLLKENILYSMIDFTNELLTNQDYDNALFKGIAKLGQATGVDRVYYWENHLNKDDNKWYTSQRYEWTNDGVEAELDNPVMQNVPFEDVWDFVDILGRSEHFNYHVKDVENDFTREFLSAQGILSILVLPVIIDNVFRGFIGFDSTKKEKDWSEVEISLLHSFVLLYKKSIERHMLEEEIIKANHNFDNFINTIPDLLIVLDLEGTIIYANESVFHRLNYTEQELIGKSILTIRPNTVKKESQKIRRGVELGGRNYHSMPIISKDGEIIDVETRITKGLWNGKEVFFTVTKDVSDLKMSEEKFHKAFNNSGVSMFITSLKEGRFLEANDTFLKTMGLSRKQIIGKTSKEIDFFEEPSQREKIIKAIKSDKKISRAEFKIKGKKDTVIEGQFNIVPVNVNREPCLLSSMIDMTDYKAMLEKLSKAKEESDIASKAKSEFLAHMSHEIRTPMNAVVSYSDLLLNTNLSPKQNNYARGIKSSSQMLMSMINDTLDWGKIESTGIKLESSVFDINDVLDTVIKQIKFKSIDNKVDIWIDKDENIPPILEGDSLRLKQVLLNLLSNAVKFTQDGQVIASIKSLKRDSHKIKLQFSISDTGVGIAEDDIDSIFEPFKQVGNNIINGYSGTGLGLAISKKIVKLMGGDIHVKSEIGKGSTFYFDAQFKIRCQSCLVQTEDYIKDYASGLKKESRKFNYAKVLVVDDNEINQDVLNEILENAGMDVTLAGSGAEALERIGLQKFDIVLMDLRMPQMDGYETIAKIRQDYSIDQLPIIAVTASVSIEERAKAIKASFNNYLIKPIDKKKLLELIEEEINGYKRLEDKTMASDNGWQKRSLNPRNIDMQECLNHFEGNKDFVNRILKNFYFKHKDSVKEIKEALATNDFKRASRIVHTVKGIAGEIKAHEVYQQAEFLESEINKNTGKLDAQLEKFRIKLENLINAIEELTYEETSEEKDRVSEAVGIYKTKDLVEEFEMLLKESDMDANKLVEELAYLTRGSQIENEILQIKEYCQQYDFDKALELLNELKKPLKRGVL